MRMPKAKEIHIHKYSTGRVRRYAYYDTFIGASCAYGLLRDAGWRVNKPKYLPAVRSYYVFAEIVGHEPSIEQRYWIPYKYELKTYKKGKLFGVENIHNLFPTKRVMR